MRKKSMFLLTSGVLCLAATPAFAISANKLLTGGEGIGYTIIFLSVVGVALAIEAFVSIRREKLAPPNLVEELEQLLNEEQYQEALELCESQHNFLTAVMSAALPKIEHGFASIEQAAKDVHSEEATKLHTKISYLSLIGAIGPMMGLLGTVWGMVGAFDTIAQNPNPEPAQFAGDISLALITTIQGLLVAIPMNAAFFWFRAKVTKSSLEVGAIVEDLIDRFRGK